MNWLLNKTWIGGGNFHEGDLVSHITTFIMH
jgi:hypothetical protein